MHALALVLTVVTIAGAAARAGSRTAQDILEIVTLKPDGKVTRGVGQGRAGGLETARQLCRVDNGRPEGAGSCRPPASLSHAIEVVP